MPPVDVIKIIAEIGVLVVSAWGAYTSQKVRADLLELKDKLKDWADERFVSQDVMTVYDRRLDRLEDRPSNRGAIGQIN